MAGRRKDRGCRAVKRLGHQLHHCPGMSRRLLAGCSRKRLFLRVTMFAASWLYFSSMLAAVGRLHPTHIDLTDTLGIAQRDRGPVQVVSQLFGVAHAG